VKSSIFYIPGRLLNLNLILCVFLFAPNKSSMLKACLLAFVSGIFFFFLILQSAWWLVPGVLTWTAIFIWQDRQESTRANDNGLSDQNKGD
jgi:hypothetical protein